MDTNRQEKRTNRHNDLIRRIAEAVKSGAAADPRIRAVFLLGSAAQGDMEKMRPDSDIDLAVMPEQGLRMGRGELRDFSVELSMQLGKTVDIGIVSSNNLVYSYEALLSGISLYERDPEAVALARANLLGLYLQFNLDRREVIEAYRAG